jgi:hypothetical protein
MWEQLRLNAPSRLRRIQNSETISKQLTVKSNPAFDYDPSLSSLVNPLSIALRREIYGIDRVVTPSPFSLYCISGCIIIPTVTINDQRFDMWTLFISLVNPLCNPPAETKSTNSGKAVGDLRNTEFGLAQLLRRH